MKTLELKTNLKLLGFEEVKYRGYLFVYEDIKVTLLGCGANITTNTMTMAYKPYREFLPYLESLLENH